MKKSLVALILIVSAVALVALRATDAGIASREVTVTLSMRTWDKGPIVGWGVFIHAGSDEHWLETNEDGIAVFKVQVSEAEHHLVLNCEGTIPESRSGEAWQRQIDTARLLRTSYYFPYFSILNHDVHIDLLPGQSEYRIELVAQPAVKATALIVDRNQNVPVNTGLVSKREGSDELSGGGVSRAGQLTASGLPKNQSNEIYLYVPPFIYPIPLTAEQTKEDVDLGKVFIDYRYHEPAGTNVKRLEKRNATNLEFLDIQAIGFKEAAVTLAPYPAMHGVVLISAEHSDFFVSLYTSNVGDVGQEYKPPKSLHAPREWPDIPAGVYYAIPGSFYVMHFQLAALDAVRAGHDLTQWGIPKFTIEGGDKLQQFNFDAAEAAKAVQRMMKSLAEQGGASSNSTTRPSTP